MPQTSYLKVCFLSLIDVSTDLEKSVHRQNQFTSKDFSIKRQQIKDTLTNNKFFIMHQPVRNPLKGLHDFVSVNIMFKFSTN